MAQHLPPFAGEPEDLSALSELEQVERLKHGLMARATGGFCDEREYRVLRGEVRKNATLFGTLPAFLRTCSDLSQYWSFIQKLLPSYQERRDYLWDAFAPAIDYLETKDSGLVVTPDREMLAQFNAQGVHIAWDKALNRRNNDPEGAITAARTLIETVCKHILDDAGIPYGPTDDLPNLWHRTARVLNPAPSQHQDELCKAILGNCQTSWTAWWPSATSPGMPTAKGDARSSRRLGTLTLPSTSPGAWRRCSSRRGWSRVQEAH